MFREEVIKELRPICRNPRPLQHSYLGFIWPPTASLPQAVQNGLNDARMAEPASAQRLAHPFKFDVEPQHLWPGNTPSTPVKGYPLLLAVAVNRSTGDRIHQQFDDGSLQVLALRKRHQKHCRLFPRLVTNIAADRPG